MPQSNLGVYRFSAEWHLPSAAVGIVLAGAVALVGTISSNILGASFRKYSLKFGPSISYQQNGSRCVVGVSFPSSFFFYLSISNVFLNFLFFLIHRNEKNKCTHTPSVNCGTQSIVYHYCFSVCMC